MPESPPRKGHLVRPERYNGGHGVNWLLVLIVGGSLVAWVMLILLAARLVG